MNFEIRQPSPALRFPVTINQRTRTTRIILHHYHSETATPQDVHAWHNDRGFGGFGYNFAVDMDGTIWEGRGIGAFGVHTAGNNHDSIGIACQGRYDDRTTAMPDTQFNALVALIRHIRSIYGEIPILGHRDVTATACPGQHFPMDEVRRLEHRPVTPIVQKDTMTACCPPTEQQVPTPTPNPAQPPLTLTDFELDALCRMVWAEARGEDDLGQRLVVHVIRNRIASAEFSASRLLEVLFQVRQFAPVRDGAFDRATPDERIRRNVQAALSEPDQSQGALFFNTVRLRETSEAAQTRTHVFDHMGHSFYR